MAEASDVRILPESVSKCVAVSLLDSEESTNNQEDDLSASNDSVARDALG